MTTQNPPQETPSGPARSSPLTRRIGSQQQGGVSPTRTEAPPQQTGAEQTRPALGLNRGALLSRLQGTHQPHLNRGFYSLLQAAVPAVPTTPISEPQEEAVASDYRVVLVDTETLTPNPHQPRLTIDEEALDRLAQNIREQGILEPLEVMPAPTSVAGGRRSYWVISGERRRQAAIRAAVPRVPVIIREVSARAALQMFLSMYIHTHPLTILDRARAYATLISEMGMTVPEVAERVGAPPQEIEVELAFLGLEDPIQESLNQGRLQSAQAAVLLKATDQPARMALWQYALRYRASPERMEGRLTRMLGSQP